jgi:hypothetical protein
VTESFGLVATIDSASWPGIPERELRVVVGFDPKMTMFDAAAWSASPAPLGDWQRGSFTQLSQSTVELQFVSVTGAPAQVVGVDLPPIPFRAFVGERAEDLLRVSLTAVGNACASEAVASAPIALDSICGLSVRLFEFTGSPFVLKQNRPNPAAEETTIDFTLSMESDARLELFGPDGRLVRVLVDARMIAGDYSVPVDLRGLSSGFYYYRLTSGPFVSIRHMQIAQ